MSDAPKITPEMIEAGRRAYLRFDNRFEPITSCVERVYRAMEQAREHATQGDAA